MMKFVVVCCALVATALAAPSPQEHQTSLFEEVYDIYSSCAGQDLTVCLKMKALGIVQRATRSTEINIVDGFKIVKNEDSKASRADNARSLNDIESSLPSEPKAREAAIDEAIVDSATKFLSTHEIEISNSGDARSVSEESRGKKKKVQKFLMPLLILLKLKFLLLAPILIGGLALLALKALAASKIALILSGILAFQKLLGNKGQSFEVVHPVGHDEHQSHSGWGRAYHAQKPAGQ